MLELRIGNLLHCPHLAFVNEEYAIFRLNQLVSIGLSDLSCLYNCCLIHFLFHVLFLKLSGYSCCVNGSCLSGDRCNLICILNVCRRCNLCCCLCSVDGLTAAPDTCAFCIRFLCEDLVADYVTVFVLNLFHCNSCCNASRLVCCHAALRFFRKSECFAGSLCTGIVVLKGYRICSFYFFFRCCRNNLIRDDVAGVISDCLCLCHDFADYVSCIIIKQNRLACAFCVAGRSNGLAACVCGIAFVHITGRCLRVNVCCGCHNCITNYNAFTVLLLSYFYFYKIAVCICVFLIFRNFKVRFCNLFYRNF